MVQPMTFDTRGRAHVPSNSWQTDLAAKLVPAGTHALRYGLVLLLTLWGAFKFAAFEAEAIRPLLENSPLFSWLYPMLGIRGTSALVGVVELVTALLIASRPWLPKWSAIGSLLATGTFVVTLSFLITTPGAFAPTSPWSGFLLKDIILLGAALYTAGEACSAAARVNRTSARAVPDR